MTEQQLLGNNQLVVTVHRETERAAPHDIAGKTAIGDVRVVLVPAGLKLGDERLCGGRRIFGGATAAVENRVC